MPDAKEIVINTSPLLALIAGLGSLNVLKGLYCPTERADAHRLARHHDPRKKGRPSSSAAGCCQPDEKARHLAE
jgi:hypothetical protein